MMENTIRTSGSGWNAMLQATVTEWRPQRFVCRTSRHRSATPLYMWHRRSPSSGVGPTSEAAEETWELKVYGTSFDELCLIMIGFDRGQRVPCIIAELMILLVPFIDL